MGLIDNMFTRLLQASEMATTELRDAQLRGAANTIEDGEKHVQLAADLRYPLISITTNQQRQGADSFSRAMALKSTGNCAAGLQSHWEHGQLGI